MKYLSMIPMALLLLGGALYPAVAQEEEEELPIYTIEELVVVGERLEPGMNLEVSQQEVAARATRDVGALFRTIPQAGAIRRGGTGLDPVVRGFRGEQLTILVDGAAQAWAACPNRMDPPTMHIEPEDLQKIELFPGPYTVRFGSSVGGVVNLVMTRPPRVSHAVVHGTVTSGYESAYEGRRIRGELSANWPWGDLTLTGAAKDYRNYEDGRGDEVSAAFRTNSYSVKLGASPTSNQRIQFSHRQSFARDMAYPALPMDARKDDTQFYALDYRLHRRAPYNMTLTTRLWASLVDHVMDNSLKPNATMVTAVTDAHTRARGGRAEGQVMLKGGHRLYIGADYSRHFQKGFRTRDFLMGPMAGTTLFDIVWPDAEMETIGGFGELRWTLSPTLLATVGARVDRATGRADNPEAAFEALYPGDLERTDVVPSGQVGLSWQATPHLELSTKVGTGARVPSVEELYIYLLPVGLDPYDYLGDPTLEPERNIQGEVRGAIELAPARIEATLFHSRVSDYVSARIDTTVTSRSPGALGVKRFTSISTATISGGHLRAALDLGRGFELSGSVAASLGRDEDADEDLPEMAPPEARMSLCYCTPGELFRGEVEGRFVAKQDRISESFGETETAGFGVCNARAWLNLGSHVTLRAGVDNLFDHYYREHLNRNHKVDGSSIAEPGRSLSVELTAGLGTR
jgi:iron complex outermembrane receptor protein